MEHHKSSIPIVYGPHRLSPLKLREAETEMPEAMRPCGSCDHGSAEAEHYDRAQCAALTAPGGRNDLEAFDRQRDAVTTTQTQSGDPTLQIALFEGV